LTVLPVCAELGEGIDRIVKSLGETLEE